MILSGQGRGEIMTHTEMITRLEREKELIEDLNRRLEQELDLISRGDVQALEDSLPAKEKIIRSIALNRGDNEKPQTEPDPEHAAKVRTLQNDLAGLWKRITGLNDISKTMITQRLSDIDAQMEIFFTGMRKGYNRDGTKSMIDPHTIKTGA